MKVHLLLIVVLLASISYLLPKVITREPIDADIPFRVKMFAAIGLFVIERFPSFGRWFSSLKVPKSTEEYNVKFEKMIFPDWDGEIIAIDLNIYTPKGLSDEAFQNLPVLLFFHGGAFMIGHPNNLHNFFDELMTNSDQKMIIVAPDYRKHPEYEVDDAVRDGIETLRYINRRYGEERNVIISGESAGGKLVLALSYHLKNSGYEDHPKSRVLAVPIYTLFCRSMKCRENSSFKNGYIESLSFQLFLHGEDGTRLSEVNYWYDYDDVEDLPRMVVVTAEYDYLRDEAYSWVKKFPSDGIKNAEYFMIEGEIHGFLESKIACRRSSISKVVKLIAQKAIEAFNN